VRRRLLVQLAEPRIAIPVGVPLDVLVPKDLQRDVLALQLAVNRRPVGLGATAVTLLLASRGEELAHNRAGPPGYPGIGRTNPNSLGNMRSGSNQLIEIFRRDAVSARRSFTRQRDISFEYLVGAAADFGVGTVAVEGLIPLGRSLLLLKWPATIIPAARRLHAEHYFRIASASREGSQQGTSPQPTAPTDAAISETEEGSSEADPERSQPGWGDDRPGFL